jgi:Invasin, domain 3
MKIISLLLLAALVLTCISCDSRNLKSEDYQLTLQANPSTIFRDNNQTSSTISAIVKDNNDFAVTGIEVLFRTNIGSILGAVSTDSSGVAESTFWDSNALGIATIEAFCGETSAQTQVTIIEPVNNEVASIAFDNAPLNIQVQGTGGQESSTLQAYLHDLNGNIIDTDQEVFFELLNHPFGALINGDTTSDTVSAQGGYASVTISSGTSSGIVRVRAATYNENGLLISAEKSNIIIHSGPPNSVDFSISGDDSGEDMSGGLWRVEVSALLTDNYGNPVDSGTAVFFSLPEDPDFASVQANSYVGNENANGDTLEGTAFTYLIYEGTMTNDYVLVQVDTGEFNDTDSLRLPLQVAHLDIAVTPAHLDWDDSNPNNPPDEQSVTVRVIVKDGQNNPINNQRVIFSSSLGEPLDMGTDDDNDIFTEFTGLQGEPGLVLKDVQFRRYECPAPGPGGPGMTSCTITATILGSVVSGSSVITLFRYEDFNP